MMAFVDPAMADRTVIALRNAASVMISEGGCRTSEFHCPAPSLHTKAKALGGDGWRRCRERQRHPIASATHAIVEAVPITMQVPAVGASSWLTSSFWFR